MAHWVVSLCVKWLANKWNFSAKGFSSSLVPLFLLQFFKIVLNGWRLSNNAEGTVFQLCSNYVLAKELAEWLGMRMSNWNWDYEIVFFLHLQDFFDWGPYIGVSYLLYITWKSQVTVIVVFVFISLLSHVEAECTLIWQP